MMQQANDFGDVDQPAVSGDSDEGTRTSLNGDLGEVVGQAGQAQQPIAERVQVSGGPAPVAEQQRGRRGPSGSGCPRRRRSEG